MALIKSISGIRGTIGGEPGEGLTPVDIVKFTSAYAVWAKKARNNQNLTIVVGRDARISGPVVSALVVATLNSMGCNVVNIGPATTPTTELAVTAENADGGIILTASHNPKEWNALKLLNHKGEFLNEAEGAQILKIAEAGTFVFADVGQLGKTIEKSYTNYHIQQVLSLKLVDKEAIEKAGFTVAVDAVNSVGGIAMPPLLKALGVKKVVEINCHPNGHFAHTPEPLPENLVETSEIVSNSDVDVCFVVDPDVDRLVIINEDGSIFGEENTIVAIADYVLEITPGNTVSNLSSSRALKDITEKHGQKYETAAVGEVNVVEKMKTTEAVIGGEGNGGVIYPASHYGRDALVGAALFLSHLAKSGVACSQLRKKYPDYFISKNKIELTPEIDVDKLLEKVKNKFTGENITDIDGVKIDFADSWVHLRKSNTEPIIRIYSEAKTKNDADKLAKSMVAQIQSLL
ncbi:MAG: phosphoglucosamine mutase [Draconibacterium sp.]|nr:MAG: phosphoglucosamine mutase [Draconibacterium sp.]